MLDLDYYRDLPHIAKALWDARTKADFVAANRLIRDAINGDVAAGTVRTYETCLAVA
jgi:hypothetical protein